MDGGDSSNRVGEEAVSLNVGHDGLRVMDGDGISTDEEVNRVNSAGDDSDSSEEDYEEVDREEVPTVRIISSYGMRLSIQIDLKSSVEDLKSTVARITGWRVREQRFIFRGRLMKNDQTLESYGVEDYQVIRLVTRPDAGTRDKNSTSTEAGSNGERLDRFSPLFSAENDPDRWPELEKTQAGKNSKNKPKTPNKKPLPNPWASTGSKFF